VFFQVNYWRKLFFISKNYYIYHLIETKMNYQLFRTTFKNYPVFSKIEITKLFPSFDAKNLINWQRKTMFKKSAIHGIGLMKMC
jgi:hypothetical protein